MLQGWTRFFLIMWENADVGRHCCMDTFIPTGDTLLWQRVQAFWSLYLGRNRLHPFPTLHLLLGGPHHLQESRTGGWPGPSRGLQVQLLPLRLLQDYWARAPALVQAGGGGVPRRDALVGLRPAPAHVLPVQPQGPPGDGGLREAHGHHAGRSWQRAEDMVHQQRLLDRVKKPAVVCPMIDENSLCLHESTIWH